MLTTYDSRPKRLTRPETPPAFRLTDRDVALLQAVGRWRFATSDQLVRYARIADPAASEQNITRRLLLLFAHRYLDRPSNQHIQLQSFSHLVYGIGRRGAELLAELGEHYDPRLNWATKNRRASNAWLIHALGVTETMILFEAASATRGLKVVDGPALLDHFPATTQALRDPFRLRVTMNDGPRRVALSVIPDRLLSVYLPGNRRLNFALELDTGSMSVTGRFARKIQAYVAAYRGDRHQSQWNLQGFRVATVTTSDKRIRSMLQAQRTLTNGKLSGMFVYTTPSALLAHGPFGPIWTSLDREHFSIVESA